MGANATMKNIKASTEVDKIKKAFRYLKPHKKLQLLVFFICFFQSIVSFAYPVLMQITIDQVIVEKRIDLLGLIIMSLIIVFLLGILWNFSSGAYMRYIVEKISYKMRLEIFSKIQKIPYDNKYKNDSGEFLTRITDDIDVISEFVTVTILKIANFSMNVICALVLMLYYSPTLSVIAIVATIIQLVVTLRYSKIIRANQDEIRETNTWHVSYTRHIFSNLMQVKINNLYSMNRRDYVRILSQYFRLGVKNFCIEIKFGSLLSFIGTFSSMLILILGVLKVFVGTMTIGVLFVFDSIYEAFSSASESILSVNVDIQRTMVSIDRIDDLLSIESENKDYISPKRKSLDIKHIRFDNISFHYVDENQNALNKLNLSLEKGKIYWIVGDNGEGKSTIINLLLKFYGNYNGKICINGKDINSIDSDLVRHSITLCTEDVVIFDKTLKDNILLKNRGTNDLDSAHIFDICGIDEIAAELPRGYDSKLEKEIVNLSLGQKGKIGVARALLRDSSVMVFDEAITHIDIKSKQKIMSYIRQNYKSKTVIFISHDLDFIEYSDVIYKITNGEAENISSIMDLNKEDNGR